MPIDLTQCRRLLDTPDLETLFIERLGWDRHRANHRLVTSNGDFTVSGFAEKRGFAAFICEPGADRRIPDHHTRALIDREVTKIAREHIIIYTDADQQEQLWQWVRRGKDQPIKRREFAWRRGQTSGLLLERILPAIAFSLAEEERLTLPDVTVRTTAAFDVEKVTKRFYERFQAEHNAFHKFIEGIKDVAHRDWYASVMLNRLMFCYFIQKKGLLDGDHDYLRNRLERLQQTRGKDQFWSFYRHFLLRLFHEGLGQRPAQRKKELDALVGRIPYLNGGLFDIHELEREYPDIQISDDAFERLFAFFDEYRWHLDERPLRENNEINPDVLGYIFEKYINQKQMGAYYTKEDITGYISQNTILPFILDQAAKNCAIAFKPDSKASVWRLLADDPDAYIYEPVRRGVIDENGEVIPLPPEIEAGITDVSKRDGWNRRAPEPYALPTETWREHIHRRQRCLDLRGELAAGEVTAVNDLVTLNLDIRQFVEDLIVRCEGPELLRAVWRCLVGHIPNQSNEKHEPGVSVLDPTCGSGAFLFAALNVLEPLYEACLDRMEGFVEDLERAQAAGDKVDSRKFGDFRRTLAEVAEHPNPRYFILKSIIVNNLYGVDIMAEACEICKLRLFLKLVAQVDEGVGGIDKIEPLPDIDFNIRVGNTLVGFTSLDAVKRSMEGRLDFGNDIERIETQAEAAATAFRLFREMQTKRGLLPRDLVEGKRLVREQLRALDDELNSYLAAEYGVDASKTRKYQAWLRSHQPFHWLVDFHRVLAGGGFDVIIGNPPYVGVGKVDYLHPQDRQSGIPDLYGHVLLRTRQLTRNGGRCGMIVPLSICFSDDFKVVRRQSAHDTCSWYSSFDNIPAALFAGVSQRCTIWLAAIDGAASGASTPLCRWRSSTRPFLFPSLHYTDISSWPMDSSGIPRVGQRRLFLLAKAIARAATAGCEPVVSVRKATCTVGFAPAGRNFLSAFIEPPPCIDAASNAPASASAPGALGFNDKRWPFVTLPVLVGELHFWHWLTHGDGFHVTAGTVSQLINALQACDQATIAALHELGELTHAHRFEALVFKKNAGKYVGNFNYRKHVAITRRADLLVLRSLGCDRTTALDLFGHVQRVLAINESAGERSIPVAIKSRFSSAPVDPAWQKRVFKGIDSSLRQYFGFTNDEWHFLMERDVIHRGDDE